MPNRSHESPLATYGRLPLSMQGAKPGTRLYMGLSGGLDSAYMAYRLLSMGNSLLLHHCTYKTSQTRYPHEERAYLAVLAWLVERGLTSFTVIKSEYAGNAGLTADEVAVIGQDRTADSVEGWNLDYRYLIPEAGKHLHTWRRRNRQSRQDIRHIVIPSHAESRRTLGDPEFNSFWRAACSLAGRELIALEPMKRYTRPEIIGDMPPDLVALCWWCRTPKDGQPCHECSTCKVVDPALAINGLEISIRGEVVAP